MLRSIDAGSASVLTDTHNHLNIDYDDLYKYSHTRNQFCNTKTKTQNDMRLQWVHTTSTCETDFDLVSGLVVGPRELVAAQRKCAK